MLQRFTNKLFIFNEGMWVFFLSQRSFSWRPFFSEAQIVASAAQEVMFNQITRTGTQGGSTGSFGRPVRVPQKFFKTDTYCGKKAANLKTWEIRKPEGENILLSLGYLSDLLDLCRTLLAHFWIPWPWPCEPFWRQRVSIIYAQ